MERGSHGFLEMILAGPRALAVLARRAMLDRPLPKSGSAVPVNPPKNPMPVIDGAEATVE